MMKTSATIELIPYRILNVPTIDPVVFEFLFFFLKFFLRHLIFSLFSDSMFWLWAAQCFMRCFMANWPRTRMKSIFQMWNRQHFWQC